jgi:ribonuclease HI
MVTIYSDGSCLNNPGGPGGVGVVVLEGDQRREISRGYDSTTNNRMELLAAILGLEALDRPREVTLYSDSAYVVDNLREGYAGRWKSYGWRLKPKGKTPVKNADLWDRLLHLCTVHSVRWHRVQGHAGNPENERCDQLAGTAARNNDLDADEGFLTDAVDVINRERGFQSLFGDEP